MEITVETAAASGKEIGNNAKEHCRMEKVEQSLFLSASDRNWA